MVPIVEAMVPTTRFAPSFVSIESFACTAAEGSVPPTEATSVEKPAGTVSTANTSPEASSCAASSAPVAVQAKFESDVLVVSSSARSWPRASVEPSAAVAPVSSFTIAAGTVPRWWEGSRLAEVSSPA